MNFTFNEHFLYQNHLGHGGFGKVVQVFHRQTREEVAVKIINKKQVELSQQQALRNEAEILESLNHPNIVKFKQVIESNNHIYLVMELMRGGNLYKLMKLKRRRREHFTEEQIILIMKSILQAIVYIHSKGVVHRDVKPQNILLSNKEITGDIKITDFGLSLKFDSHQARMMNGTSGTMIYMAPEQAAGRNQLYSTSVDI